MCAVIVCSWLSLSPQAVAVGKEMTAFHLGLT